MGTSRTSRKMSFITIFIIVSAGYHETHSLPSGMTASPLSNDEIVQKIKGLFVHAHPHSDHETDMQDMFSELETISQGMPESFRFDLNAHGPGMQHPKYQRAKESRCMRTPNQFRKFLHRIKDVLTHLRQEHSNDSEEQSEEIDASVDVGDKDDNSKSFDTPDTPDTLDSPELPSDDFPTEFSTTSEVSVEELNPMDVPENPTENMSEDADDTDGFQLRRKRSDHLENFDLDETLDRLQDDDIECLTSFIDDDLEDYLCHRYAHRSVVIFAKLVQADVACDDVLMADGSDHEMELDMPHQIFLMDQLKQKPRNHWTDDDVTKVMMLAPDAFDDDVLNEVSDEFFHANLRYFGHLAARKQGNPHLRYAFRGKIDKMHPKNMSATQIGQLGPGLLALTYDQIDELDGFSLLQSDIDDIFDETVKPHGHTMPKDHHDKDDDDDVDDDARYSLGRLMKHAFEKSQIGNRHIARALHFLHDDMDFVHSVEPDELYDSLKEIRTYDYDDSEAQLLYNHLSKAKSFPPVSQMSGVNLTNLGRLIKGMGVTEIQELRKDALEDALDHIQDIDFDEVQASEILNKILDQDEIGQMHGNQLRRYGTLLKGLQIEHLEKMDDSVVSDIADDLDGMELEESVKRMIAEKIRQSTRNMDYYKFMELEDFADVITLDDLDEIKINNLPQLMNVTSGMNWKLPQAVTLVSKFKEAKAMKNLRISHLPLMGNMIKGLQPDDLDHLVVDEDDAFDLAEALENVQEELTSAQIDQLVEDFVETADLEAKKITIMDSDAMQGSSMLAYLDNEEFDNLEFTIGAKRIFMSQVAKMPTSKMTRNHVQFLAKKMMNMLEETEHYESDTESVDEKHSRHLRNLGQMALGLTPSQIRAFSGKAIIDNLDILRTFPFSKAQAKAVLDRVQTTVQRWKCRSDILARVGPLIQHLEYSLNKNCDDELVASFSAMMKGLEEHRERIKERVEEGFARENNDALDEDAIERLVNTMVSAAINQADKRSPNTRRRRAANEGMLTCDIVKSTRGAAKYIDLDHLTSMADKEFVNCLAHLGSISDWSTSAVEALANKMKKVYNSVSQWSPEIIHRAGSIISGLSPSEILQLQLKTVDTLHSVGKHGKLTTAQLNAGFRRWLTLSGKQWALKNVTGGELSSLSEFACGLEPADISKITDKTFKQSLAVIGSSKYCPPEIRTAYFMRALSVYGENILNWSPAIVGEMSHLLAGMTEKHIKQLTPQQIALVQPSVIQHLPKEGIMAMSPTQLMSLSTNQANAVTQIAYDALDDAQKNAIQSKVSVAFLKDDKSNQGDGGYYDGDNGGKTARFSVFTLSMAAVAATLLRAGLLGI